MIALNQNLAHMKNSSSSTFSSINVVSITQVICHVTILQKFVNYWPIGGRFSQNPESTFYTSSMFYTQSAVRGPQSAVRSPQSMFYTAWFCIRRSPKYPCRVLFAINWQQYKDNGIWWMLIWCMLSSPPKSCTWVVLAHLCIEDRKVKGW